MPILPCDHPEPFAAVLGVMLYPGTDGGDPRKARAFASQYLAEPLRQFHESGEILAYEDLRRIVEGGGERLDDLDERWWGATATGELFKIVFALANTDPKLASWENATRVAELVATRNKVAGSRSALWGFRKQFLTVAHLWAAWCIRDRRFMSQLEVGYDCLQDVLSFLTEAEILRHWGQCFRAPRAKAYPPLPADVWRMPDDWRPPQRMPEWPPTGRIPHIVVPVDLLSGLRGPGRPSKRR